MSDDYSAKCKAGRHHRCMLTADGCLCECHDSGGSMTPTPQPKGDEFACPAGGCLRTFPTEQGARVHFSRTHGTNADLKPKIVTHSLGPSRVVEDDQAVVRRDVTTPSGSVIHLSVTVDLATLTPALREHVLALVKGLLA